MGCLCALNLGLRYTSILLIDFIIVVLMLYGRYDQYRGGRTSIQIHEEQVEQSLDNRCVLWRTAQCTLIFE